MTLRPSAPRKGPRWLALLGVVMGLSVVLGVGLASAAIPSGYTVTVDEHGANDVPGQVDMTQMGLMASESPDLRIFWSWDSISAWTGSGQTGDACALFDTIGSSGDADAFINFVVCARVNNPTAAPSTVQIAPAAANKPVYIFGCSNKKFDRCTNPTPRPYAVGDVVAGPFGNLSASGAGDLINNSDPFNTSAPNGPGESYPNDSSIDIRILSTLVPAGVKMVNVCSYPSAGNGGNNNPFDCIRTPGAGTLIVNKTVTNDNGGTKAYSDFSFTVGSGSSTTGTVAATAFDSDGSISVSVTEGTYSVAEVGLPITGYTTSYANGSNANPNCTSLTVTAGGTTTCTITNNDNAPSLTLVKQVTNDNGGTALPAAWTLTATGYDSASPDAGTYNLSESGGPSGYTQTSLTCDNATGQVTSVTLSLGENVTCTFVNNDNAPSLTLVKQVVNDNSGTSVPSDWTLTATGYDSESPDAGTYTLSESGPGGYTQTSLTCTDTGSTQVTSVTLSLGENVTCTFVNNDNIATPGITTTMSWVLHDSATLTGFLSGGGSSTVTFTLYKDTATLSSCEASTEVDSETVAVNDVTGIASTTTGILVTEPGTYRWIASFSGNTYNAAIDSDCGDEVTVITE